MHPELLFISSDPVLRKHAESESAGLPFHVHIFQTRHQAERLPAGAQSTGLPDFESGLAVARILLVDLESGGYDQVRQWVRNRFPDAHPIFMRGEAQVLPPSLLPIGYRVEEGGTDETFIGRPTGKEGLREILVRIAAEMTSPGDAEVEITGFDALVGRSVTFRAALDMAMKAAGSPDGPVLIVGERGVGKRLLAKAIHAESSRSGRGVVEIDCRAPTPGLLENGLFGERRGAPEKRESARWHRLQDADGGTLFFNDIAALDRSLQAKLLSFIDSHRLWRIHQLCRPKYDFRVIAATDRDLGKQVRSGGFNADLYDRLCSCRIELSPLRERPSDMLLLAEHLLRCRAEFAGRPTPKLTSAAKEMLISHPWHGNARELVHMLQGVLRESQGSGQIDVRHIEACLARPVAADPVRLRTHAVGGGGQPTSARDRAASDSRIPIAAIPAGGPKGRTAVRVFEGRILIELPEGGISLDEIEKAILIAALERTDGNVVRAAQLLRMGRGSLRYRLEKYRLVEPRRRSGRRKPQPVDTQESTEPLRRAS